jgi:hypothetical protein
MSDAWVSVSKQIAEIAQVPADWRRQEFVFAVRDLISEMDARARAREVGADREDEIRAARAKLVEARDALLPLGGLVDTSPIDGVVEWLSILVGENPAPEPTTGLGRRRGSTSAHSWSFRIFVCELLNIAAVAGGRGLTLSRSKEGAAGTLVEALTLLHPHVQCIPRALSYDMLESHRYVRKEGTASPTAMAMLRRLFPPLRQ